MACQDGVIHGQYSTVSADVNVFPGFPHTAPSTHDKDRIGGVVIHATRCCVIDYGPPNHNN